MLGVTPSPRGIPEPGTGDAARPRWFAAAVLASAGAIETAWLTWHTLTRAPVPCLAGHRADCEALLFSVSQAVWGLPLAVWGHAAYALLLLLLLTTVLGEGVWVARARTGWVVLAVAMAAVSAALMLRMAALQAWCIWCVGSALISGALGALGLAELAAARVHWRAVWASLVLVVVMLVGQQAGASREAPVADPALAQALARHLRDSGAHLYGVWWCLGCREQKAMFGASASELPYVECSGGASPAGVTEYPTWEIAGARVTAVLPLDSLAARSAFTR